MHSILLLMPEWGSCFMMGNNLGKMKPVLKLNLELKITGFAFKQVSVSPDKY